MLDKYRLESYLKNNLFKEAISKMNYLNLYNADANDKSNTVLISNQDSDREVHSEEKIQVFKDVLQIQFWDDENNIGKFLVHCAVGQSRSTGMGCAVECIVNFNGSRYDYGTGSSDVKRLERYNLNLAVFDAIK